MKSLYKSINYNNLIIETINYHEDWHILKNKKILIAGGTGQIGSFLTDLVMAANDKYDLNCSITIISRNLDKAVRRFIRYVDNSLFSIVNVDINNPIPNMGYFDYVFDLASNTHPVAYSSEPVSTIITNTLGTNNLLQYHVTHHCGKFVFSSSVEIYGEARDSNDVFSENYCGYIDCNTLRAGYPESKRVAESLCQAYIREYGINAIILRYPRVYGPTILENDSKALSQFLFSSLLTNKIILKSEGKQYFSYLHVTDVVLATLFCLNKGLNGHAYNISDNDSNITLKSVAEIISGITHSSIIYDIPNETESKGYSKATVAIMDNTKIKTLGWSAYTSLQKGIQSTIDILKECLD